MITTSSPPTCTRTPPAKWADAVPKVVRNAQSLDEWVFQGEATTTRFGMSATVGWPAEQWDFRHTPRDEACLGSLRALANDVDVTRPKEEWRRRNEAAGIGVF